MFGHFMRRLLCGVLTMFPLALSECARAAEIRGQVSKADGASVEVTTDSQLLPQVGDKVEIYIELKTIKSTALVTAGTVAALNGTTIVIQVDNPKASVLTGQLAKIASEHPTKRSEAAAPASEPQLGNTASTGPTGPVGPPQGSVQKLTFDHLKAAAGLRPDTFAAQGIIIVLGSGGVVRIERAIPEMVLPAGRKQLLMVVQEPAASRYALAFTNPVHRVTITRPGVINGASMPKWKLTAMTNAGKILATTGEDKFGADPQARKFSVEANGIEQVDISVDNHWGAGTYATFSCLPIAEIEIVPQRPQKIRPTEPPLDRLGPPPVVDLPPFDDVPAAN